jgi:hypothetical protein
MLWEGEEIADDYNLPSGGDARIHFDRNTHWESSTTSRAARWYGSTGFSVSSVPTLHSGVAARTTTTSSG